MKKKKINYKKILWPIFSIFIRQKEKGVCFICGLKRHWKKMQAGHCIPKVAGGMGLYFFEKNVHCCCYRCNINLGGNGALYARRIKSVYGDEGLNEIYQRYDERDKYTISEEEYQKLIKHYSELIQE